MMTTAVIAESGRLVLRRVSYANTADRVPNIMKCTIKSVRENIGLNGGSGIGVRVRYNTTNSRITDGHGAGKYRIIDCIR